MKSDIPLPRLPLLASSQPQLLLRSEARRLDCDQWDISILRSNFDRSTFIVMEGILLLMIFKRGVLTLLKHINAYLAFEFIRSPALSGTGRECTKAFLMIDKQFPPQTALQCDQHARPAGKVVLVCGGGGQKNWESLRFLRSRVAKKGPSHAGLCNCFLYARADYYCTLYLAATGWCVRHVTSLTYMMGM